MRASSIGTRCTWIPVALAGACAIGCSDEKTDRCARPENHHDPECACLNEDRDEPYVEGMEKTGDGGITVALVGADPTPPGFGFNTWTLRILDPAGAEASDATVIVTPFMPDHGHGASDEEGTTVHAVFEATPLGENGLFEVGPMDFIMTGYWETTVEVELAGGQEDSVVFSFCLDE